MASARAQGADAYRELNRAFGALLEQAQHTPQVLITVLQGAVLGGPVEQVAHAGLAVGHGLGFTLEALHLEEQAAIEFGFGDVDTDIKHDVQFTEEN